MADWRRHGERENDASCRHCESPVESTDDPLCECDGATIERLRGVIKERETLLFDWLENGDMPGSDGPMEKTLFLFRKIGGEDE